MQQIQTSSRHIHKHTHAHTHKRPHNQIHADTDAHKKHPHPTTHTNTDTHIHKHINTHRQAHTPCTTLHYTKKRKSRIMVKVQLSWNRVDFTFIFLILFCFSILIPNLNSFLNFLFHITLLHSYLHCNFKFPFRIFLYIHLLNFSSTFLFQISLP